MAEILKGKPKEQYLSIVPKSCYIYIFRRMIFHIAWYAFEYIYIYIYIYLEN